MSKRRTLTFAQEEIDIETLRSLRSDALDGSLLCFDVPLHHWLVAHGIEHACVTDFVTEAHRQELHVLFDALWAEWNRFFDPPVRYRRIDPFQLAPTRHLYCLRRVAYAVLAIRRALDELRPEQVVCFSEPDVHGLEQPIGANRRMPLVQGLACSETLRRDLELILLDRKDVAGAVPWNDVKSPSLSQGRPCSARRPFRLAPTRPFVIVAGNDHDLIQQQPAVEALRRRGLQVLHLGLVVHDEARARLRGLAHEFHELADIDIEMPPLPGDVLSSQAEAGRSRALRRLPDPLRIYFDNPFLQSHFGFLLGAYLHKMLIQIERWMTLFDRWNPDLLAVNYDIPMAGIAQARGIPVLSMLHSMVTPVDPVYHDWPHSHLAVLSAEQVERAIEAGTQPENVRAAGHPESDVLFRQAAKQRADRNRLRTVFSTRFGIPPARRLILLLTHFSEAINSSASTFPNVDIRRARASWKQIAGMASRHPDWHLIVKGHPRSDHFDVYRDLLSVSGDNFTVVGADFGLSDVAPVCDVAVVCNVTSSVQLEVCFWNMPVILLEDARCWLHERHRDVFESWPRAWSVAELEEWLVRTGEDRGIWNEQRQATHRACDLFTGPRDGQASHRVADFIEEIAARVPAVAVQAS